MRSLPLYKPSPVPSFATGEGVSAVPRSSARNLVQMRVPNDERREYRAQQSRPSFGPPPSSYVSQHREVYGHHHTRHSYETLGPYSPAQTLVDEWPQYTHGYSRRHHYHTSEQRSRSSHSVRTLVQEDWTYKFEDDYSDTSSSAGRTYSIPPPPLRSEKHNWGLAPSFRSGSEGSSIYSEFDDDVHPRERKRWWQRILEI